ACSSFAKWLAAQSPGNDLPAQRQAAAVDADRVHRSLIELHPARENIVPAQVVDLPQPRRRAGIDDDLLGRGIVQRESTLKGQLTRTADDGVRGRAQWRA